MLLLLFLLPGLISAENCITCVGAGNKWCVESSQCNSTLTGCQTPITLQLNCPTSPNPKYAYDDNFMRTQQIVLASASHGDQIQQCFDNQIPTMKLYQVRTVQCSPDNPNITCRGFTAYDVSQQALIISFRGSHGDDQTQQLFDGYANYGIQSYSGMGGKIFKVIYDSFMLLWNGGMQQDLRTLKYKYPGFELWVNGHSLGGMLSWVASSYLVTSGLYKTENIKVIAMASPRMGDYDFAVWYTATFPYSYHIVHRRDIIPRMFTVNPHDNTTALFHPRTEVWYNNFMNLNYTYNICQEADGNYCSASVTDNLTMWDHIYYFNVNMPQWGRDGCPQNRTPYSQPLDTFFL
ncbi:hypothetical protein GCK72_009400 [Caenorhabditis remanei]|uniref:Fungal lipase-type domain-containing protein n=1 Tax=Caenorhabditis remanei TaxID=31234 RepID=A0A6A5H2T8_CAERE|nr:hypothetical protein GCK72_009400 [Caenorhabditis remanei]KAF1761146.1 hypothetical protein GCK72_009400 [Caenorhabditis remanei]